jgi:hypothetical protein
MRYNKIIIKVVLFFLGFAAIERVCYFLTDGFRYEKTQKVLEVGYQEAPTPAIDQILKQRFSFLGSGVQCYAFVSEDKEYVLKLIKHHHSGPSVDFLEQHTWPIYDSYRKKMLQSRKKRIDHIYTSCKIAHQLLSEETGTVYTHFHPTAFFGRQMTIVDKIGIQYPIDLDNTAYVLQKRATLVFETLDDLMEKENFAGACKAVDSLLTMIVKRSQKGVSNSDPIIRRNIGFVGTQAIEFDIGSYSENSFLKKPYACKRAVFDQTLELEDWLEKKYPNLLDHYHQQLNLILADETL